MKSFQIPESPPLTLEEYLKIRQIKKDYKNWSFQNIRSKIIAAVPRLKFEQNCDIIKKIEDKALNYLEFSHDLRDYLCDIIKKSNLIEMIHRPIDFLNKNPFPFFESRKNLKWTKEEDDLLRDICREGNKMPSFFVLPLVFPGRTGNQIRMHFYKLLDDGLIEDPRNKNPVRKETYFKSYFRRIFLPSGERALAETLVSISVSGIQVGKKLIIEKAEMTFRLPSVLAERVTYQDFFLHKKEIYDEKGNYTIDFIEQSEKFEKEFETKFKIIEEDEEPINREINKIVREHFLPIPCYSSTWMTSFMRRNHLGWRTAHYARRCAIDPVYSEIFLNQLAEAIINVGGKNVYNFDETSVRIVNSSTKTLALKGTEEVIVNQKRNDREAFTAIGTITLEQTLPLIILKKGKNRNKGLNTKLRSGDATELWYTNNNQGWVNEDIMLRYLDWLSINFTEGFPSVVVCDCYKAHLTPSVREKASSLNILLVVVPANGTGKFQPLDRIIFGIIKAKLRALANTEIFSGENRFEMIYNHLTKAWSEITEKHLKAAWSIPGLKERIEKLMKKEDNKRKKVDFEIDNEVFDINNEEEEDIIEYIDPYDENEALEEEDEALLEEEDSFDE